MTRLKGMPKKRHVCEAPRYTVEAPARFLTRQGRVRSQDLTGHMEDY